MLLILAPLSAAVDKGGGCGGDEGEKKGKERGERAVLAFVTQ